MKKLLISFIVVAIAFFTPVFCLGNNNQNSSAPIKVAMVTDFADVNDASFNQATYEASVAICKEKNIPFTYYKPADNTDFERLKSMDLAVERGYNVIICPGFAFNAPIALHAMNHPNVKYIGIDIAIEDYPDGYVCPPNIYYARFKEEIAGFMAGYATIMEGYRNVGFLGGMEGAAVKRYGYGFIQGVDEAINEVEAKNPSGGNYQVRLDYVYGGQFFGDAEITTYMDSWYKRPDSPTQVVFACGGSIYTSAAQAAKNNGGRVIGVDTDQSQIIDRDYGKGMCLTSAMKGIGMVVKDVITVITDNPEEWDSGFHVLGLVTPDKEKLDTNYVQLPLNSWAFVNFKKDNYSDLVYEIWNGSRVISDNIQKMPETSVNTMVVNHGSIK